MTTPGRFIHKTPSLPVSQNIGNTKQRYCYRYPAQVGIINKNSANTGQCIVHMPERCTNLLGHFYSITSIECRTTAIHWPSGQKLLLDVFGKLKASACQNYPPPGLKRYGLAFGFGLYTNDFSSFIADQFHCRCLIHYRDATIFHLC